MDKMADENAKTTEETQAPPHTEENKTDAGPDTLTGAGLHEADWVGAAV